MKLTKARIHRYKCVESDQTFDVEPDATVLVGMNESGKTSLLEALAKVNYFNDDEVFQYNLTLDYPRRQLKAIERSGDDPEAVTLEFSIDKELCDEITEDIAVPFEQTSFTYTKRYSNKGSYSFESPSFTDFLSKKLPSIGINDQKYVDALASVKSETEFDAAIKKLQDSGETAEFLAKFKDLKKYFTNSWHCNNPIQEYIAREYFQERMPKFMYYDDYYMLPARISIDKLSKKEITNESEKTAAALLEVSDIDTGKILQADSYEEFIAELEATQVNISDILFKYWTTNSHLSIQFNIDKQESTDSQNNRRIVERILDIRVKNQRNGVSLSLKNRSKGFNWFFSFLVWFMKIEQEKDNSYILLLDEPGLNLHAMAQHDLLKYIDDLSDKYQVIYTTHSPFMIDSSKLKRVRTVLEQSDGTHISDCLQEKDPNTLFPLQAALGYTIAQNLFVSENNLVVEGIADFIYLSALSEKLKDLGKTGLNEKITIMPVGGADKIASFVSLLRGNSLNMLCLLDSFNDSKAKARLESLITQKIIKEKGILFYQDVLKTTFADVEDMFTDADYLTLYDGAFDKQIVASDLDPTKPILEQLIRINDGKEFNHYRPANYLMQNIGSVSLSQETLDNFERLFAEVNKMLKQ